MEVDVTRDAAGLVKAVSELLERGYAASRISRSLDSSDESCGERMFGSLPQLTLSPGYYKRAEYLLWLEKCRKNGLSESALSLAEAEGLMAVAQARGEFERNHPPCGVCGALQETTFATSCCKCGIEFMKRSA